MRVIRASKLEAIIKAIVITGNGRTEERILKSLAKRLNGEKKALLLPSILPRKSGVVALEGIAVLLNKGFKHKNFLFIVDKEHIPAEESFERTLHKSGFRVKTIKDEGNREITIKAIRGVCKVKIHVAIMGIKKDVEEDLAKLIELEYGDKIKPCKEERRKYLKQRDLSIEEMIEGASIKNLEEAFKPLINMLKTLE